MPYTPRTIALVCDLIHPPATPDAARIQRVHNEMFQSGSPTYRSFNVRHDGALLSNPVAAPGASSSAAFTVDRFQFREELTELTHEEFGVRVRDVAQQVARLLGVQLFTAQQVTVRTLVNPRHFTDSRRFLEAGMFGFGDETSAFGRKPQLFGIRMVFPPHPAEPNAHALRIESFHSDPRSLFIENQASFGPLVVANGLEAIRENVDAAYRFVVDRALPFVTRFDAHQQA